MKKGIMTLLSVLALALAFAGCSESDGAYSSTDTTEVETTYNTDEVRGLNTLPSVPALPVE